MSGGMVLNRNTLAGALAIQLVIVAVLLVGRSGAAVDPEPFLSFDPQLVDAVAVANEDGEVNLVKAGDDWQFADGLPADSSKVDGVLDKLGSASGGWPVATSAATAERFEVTEASHQRRVTLKAGDDTVADLYLGTSPGYRKAHARLVEGGDVYAITFSNYEAGVKVSDWLDKSLLRPVGSPRAVHRKDFFAVTKGEDGVWTSPEVEELDQSKVETLTGRFTGLTAIDVSDVPLPDEPMMAFALADDEGELTMTVYKVEEDDQKTYFATTDRVAGAYEISSYIAEQMDVVLDDLVPEPPEADDAGPGDAAEGEATADEEATADAQGAAAADTP